MLALFKWIGLWITKNWVSELEPLDIPVQPIPVIINHLPPIMTPQDILYNAVVAALGKKKTLNPNVPAEVGCGEAWSDVGEEGGIQGIPKTGFASTRAIYLWLVSNPHFELIDSPEPGATIVSPSPVSNTPHGHIGYFGKFNLQYPNDWGICSNNSVTKLFGEQWSYKKWIDYYKTYLGLPVYIFRWKG